MNKPYIFESGQNTTFKCQEAIVVLPDIYCLTDYSKRTTEEFAKNFNRPAFLIDYFFPYTNEANNFSEDDREKVHTLMQNFKGEDFVVFFRNALDEIKASYPEIESFIVFGFCFGGRLAYLAGGEKDVLKVFSFYGGGPNTENYVEGKTPIEYLISKRNNDELSVRSFFGTNDPSIPETDRKQVKEKFSESNINFEMYEYEAGHAYFQEGRKNFSEVASKASWEVLRTNLN